MTRMIVSLLVPFLLLTGCARHYVTERDAGVVDSERSITSSSDRAWSIESEPGPADAPHVDSGSGRLGEQ